MKFQFITLAFLIFFTKGFSQFDILPFEEIIQNEIEKNHFEGTILIANKGTIILEHANGLFDREEKISMSFDAKFGIASCTKMITAIAILQMVEENKISLDDSVSKILPDLKIENADKITVRNLLMHTSGLPNESKFVYAKKHSGKSYTEKTAKRKRKSVEYGDFNYANIDFVILGMILETVDKTSWEESITSRIIEPLGLSNTGFRYKGEKIDNLSTSYNVNKRGKFKKNPSFYIENFSAAGSMYSNATDMFLIDRGLHDGLLLNEESQRLFQMSDETIGYVGFGVWNFNYPFAEGKPFLMERRGSILGMNSVIVRFLDSESCIIILTNNNQFDNSSFGQLDNLKEKLIIELAKLDVE